jgi:hypothetical protein
MEGVAFYEIFNIELANTKMKLLLHFIKDNVLFDF